MFACRPVILEIPHFASLRDREREIVVFRSDNGEKWTEHTGPITDEAVRDVLGNTVESEGKKSLDPFDFENFLIFAKTWTMPKIFIPVVSHASSPMISLDFSR